MKVVEITNMKSGSIPTNGVDHTGQHDACIIDMPSSTSRNQPHAQAQLPPQDLLNGTSDDYNKFCRPLYKASITGNMIAAKVILGKRPELVQFSITEEFDTVLHIAVLGESTSFVEYLMTIMSLDDLKIPNIKGETALHKAAITGNIKISRILLNKNKNLLHIADRDGKMPIYKAASCRKRDMVDLLYTESRQMTGESWTNEDRGLVYVKCVEADLFDVALRVVTKHPILATKESVLGLLARKPHGFYVIGPGIIQERLNSLFRVCRLKIRFPDKESESDALKLLRFILEKIGDLPKDERDAIIRGPPDETTEDEKKTRYEKETQEAIHLLRTISENIAKMPAQIFSLFKKPANETTIGMNNGNQKYSSRVLFLAAEIGNTVFVVEVLQKFPDLVEGVNDNGQSIFHVAVSYGHVGIYKLLNDIGSSRRDSLLGIEDKNGNNMLHLVGEKAKGNQVQNIRGVGLRLNPKIFWFKEIETIIPPRLQEKKNAAGLTPHQVFIKNHRDLFSKGEDWMKEIATQLMVVAALVATTSYQVAFQPPGGYEQNAPFPMFLDIFLFRLFIIFDSLSFTFSTTSILMVLSILGSNYDEYDFMLSLSKQLDICLGFVFASIVTMVFTFLINYFLFLKLQFIWLPIFISVSAITPFVIFASSKYHLPSRIMRGFRKLYEPSIASMKFHLD